MTDNRRLLTRDVEASIIPAGDMIMLPGGTKVDITHRLGGNFTVVCDYGMFRISGRDADSLGEEVPTEAGGGGSGANGASGDPSAKPSEEVVWDALKTVYDPEIPVNIVDLGLVYSMQVTPIGENVPADAETSEHGWHVEVKMTLTAPGCGMGPVIAEDAKTRVEAVPGVRSAQVDIVWEPAWDQTMISQDGKMELGLI